MAAGLPAPPARTDVTNSRKSRHARGQYPGAGSVRSNAAFVELWIGPESDDILVQVAFHAVLAWLRGEVAEPRALLEAFGSLEGPLGQQLAFVGSLLRKPDDTPPAELPRVWRWVSKAAYYRRWQELTDSRWAGHRQPPA